MKSIFVYLLVGKVWRTLAGCFLLRWMDGRGGHLDFHDSADLLVAYHEHCFFLSGTALGYGCFFSDA